MSTKDKEDWGIIALAWAVIMLCFAVVISL